jgi:hypothetical protein
VGCVSKATYDSCKDEVVQLKADNEILEASKRELETSVRLLENKLALYQETFGEVEIYRTPYPPYKGAQPIVLKNNSDAANPSWEQLVTFLKKDTTEKMQYWDFIAPPGSAFLTSDIEKRKQKFGIPKEEWPENFVCSDFANLLHNNAETNGIRAAVVAIHTAEEKYGHLVNAFTTIDRGLVYIDCTGEEDCNGVDKVCCIKKGNEAICVELQDDTPLDYEWFLQQKNLFEQYKQEVLEFNTELEKVGSKFEGKWHLYAWDYGKFKAWEERLIELEKQLIPVFGEEGIVTRVEIYW